MQIFRSFAVLCCLLSLFVQGAAYAAAAPQAGMTASTDCAEMVSHDAGQSDARNASDTRNPCENMTLGCLVAMGCIAPLVLSEPSATDPVLPLPGAPFAAALADTLKGQLIRPEFPPPQIVLAA